MKKILLPLGLIVVLMGTVACDKKLKTDKDKYSYAIGQQIGKNMKAQGIDLDKKSFAQGVEDAIKGTKPKLTEDQIKEAMRKMSQGLREKEKKSGEENLKKGEAFLKENKKKDGIKVTDSGLQYKVVKEGKGKKPKPSDTVIVHYKGQLIDGKEFDSSYKRSQPAEFPVKSVIPGWTEALQLMTVGSKYELFIPSKLAYGERGNPTIPGNSVLIFDIELIDIKKKKKK